MTGTVVIGFLWTATSLAHMFFLTNYAGYYSHFGPPYLSEQLVLMRYIGSWIQRILGLAAGLGMMAQQRWATRTAICLSIFNLATVCLKHPYQAFANMHITEDPVLLWKIVILVRTFDIICFSFVIWYLNKNRGQRPISATRSK